MALGVDEGRRPRAGTEDDFVGVEGFAGGGLYAGDFAAVAVVEEGGDLTCGSSVEDCSQFLCGGGDPISCLCSVRPALVLGIRGGGRTDAGLKYPTDPSIGPSNISHALVTSLPDLNSTTPLARPFCRNVATVREQIVSFSLFSSIHPTIRKWYWGDGPV